MYLAAFLGFARGIYWLFEKAEDVLDEEVVQSISHRLKGLNPGERVQNWPDAFARSFDAVFGERALSWKRVRRSSVASVLAITVVTLFAWAVAPQLRAELGVVAAPSPLWSSFVILYLAGAVVNLLPDYLSLAESRWMIAWMKRTDALSAVLGLLVVDLVMTFLIFALPLSALIHLNGADTVSELWLGLAQTARSSWSEPVEMAASPLLLIFLYSTFFTSVWVWLFVLSTFIVRSANLLSRNLGRFNR